MQIIITILGIVLLLVGVIFTGASYAGYRNARRHHEPLIGPKAGMYTGGTILLGGIALLLA